MFFFFAILIIGNFFPFWEVENTVEVKLETFERQVFNELSC